MSAFRMIAARGPRGLPQAVPVDFARLVLPKSPNVHLAAPPGSTELPHEGAPLLPVTPDRAWEALRGLGDELPRVWRIGEWPELRQAQWVARTALMNFPDIVTGQVVELPGGAGIYLYSRSLIGYHDLGVNRRRVAVWRARLDAALRPT